MKFAVFVEADGRDTAPLLVSISNCVKYFEDILGFDEDARMYEKLIPKFYRLKSGYIDKAQEANIRSFSDRDLSDCKVNLFLHAKRPKGHEGINGYFTRIHNGVGNIHIYQDWYKKKKSGIPGIKDYASLVLIHEFAHYLYALLPGVPDIVHTWDGGVNERDFSKIKEDLMKHKDVIRQALGLEEPSPEDKHQEKVKEALDGAKESVKVENALAAINETLLELNELQENADALSKSAARAAEDLKRIHYNLSTLR